MAFIRISSLLNNKVILSVDSLKLTEQICKRQYRSWGVDVHVCPSAHVAAYKHRLIIVAKYLCLSITEDITFDHAPSPQHPKNGTDSLIECRVSGQPVPTVSWKYRGQIIETGLSCVYCVLPL